MTGCAVVSYARMWTPTSALGDLGEDFEMDVGECWLLYLAWPGIHGGCLGWGSLYCLCMCWCGTKAVCTGQHTIGPGVNPCGVDVLEGLRCGTAPSTAQAHRARGCALPGLLGSFPP
ncbi:hypothetical protein HaLaN_32550 [Haematococcus lacustris]|uniref:Uncharacterized protein n=1 Tax=Haematococcus lacustris TaxID=44745 RepID=A0A6A0AMT3_HAELA|nr:hypothetical protein HaLaN_32550 [Haematococcus lacustris]